MARTPSASDSLGLSIVGMGKAGQARLRGIEAHPQARVISTVSQRDTAGPTLDQVCADARVDAVVVCTENARHPAQVEQALRAAKHVLVEYPLAFNRAQCEALFALASRQNCVLQVEFIGQLTNRHAHIVDLIAREQVTACTMTFTGGLYRWTAAEAHTGRWGQLAVSRLLSLWRWFGPLTLTDVALRDHPDGYQLNAELVSTAGVRVRLHEQRRAGLKREQSLELKLADGRTLIPDRVTGPGDLFARDLDIFIQRVLQPGQVEAYVSDADIIAVTALSDDMSREAASQREVS